MNLPATISLLEQEGFTTEQIVRVLKCIVAETSQPERSGAARRQAAYRERHNALRNGDVTRDAKERSPTPPKEKQPTNVGLTPIIPFSEPLGFSDFWVAYPKRDGNGDKKGALKAFGPAVQRAGGHEPIIRAASRYAAHCRDKGKTGTEFVKQARSWLNGDLWSEWLPQEPSSPAVKRIPVKEGTPAWDAWKRTGQRFNAMDLKDEHGHVIGRGWYFPTEYPPQEQAA